MRDLFRERGTGFWLLTSPRPHALLAAFALLIPLLGCGDSTAPKPATLELAIVTTGHDLDADGYDIAIGAGTVIHVSANESRSVTSITPGTYAVSVAGAASNCTIDPSARNSIALTAGLTVSISITVSCRRATLHDVILFTTAEFGLPQLMAMKQDGTERELIPIGPGGSVAAPAISADGRKIAFARHDGVSWAGIFTANADGTGTTLLAKVNFDGNPAWSPDGRTVAFRGSRTGAFGDYGRIFLVDADGTHLRQLSPETADYTFDDEPVWTLDGQRVLFTRQGLAYSIRSDGTDLRQLQGIPYIVEYMRVSPDGARIAYTGRTAGAVESLVGDNRDIYTMNADATTHVRLTTFPAQEETPSWSADGRKIVFARVVDGVFQLFTMNADGSAQSRISKPDVSEGSPVWAH